MSDLVSDCLGICDEMHNTWHIYYHRGKRPTLPIKMLIFLTYQRRDTTFSYGLQWRPQEIPGAQRGLPYFRESSSLGAHLQNSHTDQKIMKARGARIRYKILLMIRKYPFHITLKIKSGTCKTSDNSIACFQDQ